MSNDSNKKHIIVLWSGGFDSTALLLGLIEKYFVDNTDDNIDIQCVSIDCPNCGESKIKRETEAKNKIIKYIKDTYNVDIINSIINVDYSNFNVDNNQGVGQPLIWLLSAIPFIPDNSIIYPGYIKGDDALCFVDDIKNLVKYASNFQLKHIDINLKMRYADKREILIYFIEKHPNLLDVCTSCENLKVDDKCNLCVPCSHIKETLLQLIMSGSSEIVKVAYEKLKEWFGIDLINYIDLRVNHDDVAICNDDCDKQIDDTIKLSEVMIDD